MTLEELSRDARVTGIVPDGPVTILDVRRHGDAAAEVTYRTGDGRVDHALLFRHQEPDLALAPRGDAWTFDADGRLFRLAAEALRIRNAHLFDPYLAVTTSLVEPLPSSPPPRSRRCPRSTGPSSSVAPALAATGIFAFAGIVMLAKVNASWMAYATLGLLAVIFGALLVWQRKPP